jgi:hypothetical protein
LSTLFWSKKNIEPKKHCRPKKIFPSIGFSLVPVLLFITPATAAPLTEQTIPAHATAQRDTE